MSARKFLDLVGATEIWDFGSTDFVGDLNRDCWEYWNGLRDHEPAAFKGDINLVDMGRHVKSAALMEWEGTRLLIKFCGSELASYFDIDPTGHYLNELPNSDVSMRRHIQSRDQVAPFIIRSPFYLARKEYQDYESINLPLLDRELNVCASLVCFSFLRSMDVGS